MMDVWAFIRSELLQNHRVVLLYVVESEGSSPGRRDFLMGVSSSGAFYGTIGGGIMERKLVEEARRVLTDPKAAPYLKRQFHDKAHGLENSGMICSGRQTMAFVPLSPVARPLIPEFLQKTDAFQLSEAGFQRVERIKNAQFQTDESGKWWYQAHFDQRPVVHIIGAGHVGNALSELMRFLGFYVQLYDDRPDLPMFNANPFAHEKKLVSYDALSEALNTAPEDFVVLVTFSYATDKRILPQIIHRKLAYLGMMGSASKCEALRIALTEEGLPPDVWKHVHAPIGIPIHSKTVQEIAVSIAAEIISVRNQIP